MCTLFKLGCLNLFCSEYKQKKFHFFQTFFNTDHSKEDVPQQTYPLVLASLVISFFCTELKIKSEELIDGQNIVINY